MRYICRMRQVEITDECIEFIEASSSRIQEKFQYLLTVISEQKDCSSVNS